MKKYNHYSIPLMALGLGLFLGWLFFSQSPTEGQHEHPSTTTETKEWTCSMHPQIRQAEPGDCPICGMNLTPAQSMAAAETTGFQMTEAAIKLAQIQTTRIGPSAAETSPLTLQGSLKTDETQMTHLVTHIPGRIEKLYVSYTGQAVVKGQKIALIYSPELITAQKELLEAQQLKDLSPGLLTAAKNKLRYWKISDATIERILSTAQIRETFPIYADHSGVVTQKRITTGDYIKKGAFLFDLANLNELWVQFDAYEKDLPNLSVGQNITFSTPSIPNTSFNARIQFIDPVIDPTTRIASVRASINNRAGQLKPEMFVRGSVATMSQNTLTVPKSAVLWTGERSVVYVKNPTADIPSFEYRVVKLGAVTRAGYKVISGLTAGEEVVTQGAFVIDAAAQLNNQASMMNQHVSPKNKELAVTQPDLSTNVPKAFQTQLTALAQTYLNIKDALVNSQPEPTAKEAQKWGQRLNTIDRTILKGEAQRFAQTQWKVLSAQAQKIATTNELDAQRQAFVSLSHALIHTLKAFGVKGETFYVQHCPMANDNIGASWLSKEQEIRNPYFGETMLNCGAVQESITVK